MWFVSDTVSRISNQSLACPCVCLLICGSHRTDRRPERGPAKENCWGSPKRPQKGCTPELISHDLATTLFQQLATESCIISGQKISFLIWKSNFTGAFMIFPVQCTNTMVVFDMGTPQTGWEDKKRHREHKCLWGLDFHILGHWWNNGTGPRSLGIFFKAFSLCHCSWEKNSISKTGIMMGFHGRIFHGWKPAHSSLSISYFNVSSVENKENHHDIKAISLWPVMISNSLDSAICFVLEVKYSCCSWGLKDGIILLCCGCLCLQCIDLISH